MQYPTKKKLIGLVLGCSFMISLLLFQNFTNVESTPQRNNKSMVFMQNFNSNNGTDGFMRVLRLKNDNDTPDDGLFRDFFQIATHQLPVTYARDSNYTSTDTKVVVHTSISDQQASFAMGAVKLSREEWQNDRGMVILKARDNMHGGTYGVLVRSAVKKGDPGFRGKAKDSGILISNNADAMTFFFVDPFDIDGTVKPMVIRADGSFAINGRGDNPKEVKNLLYIRPTGNVGIGTKNPMATLDINGTVRLAQNSVAPAICSKKIAGTIALSSRFTTCVCNGLNWVLSADGKSRCEW